MSPILMQVLGVRTFSGTSKSGRPYAFLILEGHVSLEGQARVCELMVEKAEGIQAGDRVEVIFRPAIDQNKRLGARVESVRRAGVQPGVESARRASAAA
jgi:hypothetical protein